MNEYQKTVLQEALRYEAMGLSVIPLLPKNKKPAIKWEKYKNERATPEEIKAWFSSQPDLNIGIVTGPVSGVAVVDLDHGADPSAYPATSSVKTGSGNWHLYYSIPAGMHVPSAVRVREDTDIRGQAGYVVAPPSIHPDEPYNSYEWADSFDSISDLPPFPLHLFRDTARNEPKSDWRSIPERSVSEGSRNNEATRYIGGVLGSLPQEVWSTAGWGGLKELNRTFSPPLKEGELRSIYESISDKEARRCADIPGEPTQTFEPFTLSQLYQQEFPPGRWAVRDLIPLGGITALTGDSNSYKTFLTQSLAVCVVTGEPFLGHFPVSRGKVLIVDEENHRGYIKQRFENLGLEANDDLLFVSQAGFRADDKAHIEKLRAIIEQQKPVLIVMDSLIDIHSRNENDAPEMNSVFLALRSLVNDDAALVVIHHHRKPQLGQGSRPGQSMRGSSGILAAVDAHIAVDRKGATDLIVTQDKLRIQPQLPPFKVTVVPTEDGHTVFAYQGQDKSHEEALLAVQDAVLNALFESPAPMTIKELIATTGASEGQIRAAVATVVDTGAVYKKAGPHNTALYSLSITNIETANDSNQLEIDTVDQEDLSL